MSDRNLISLYETSNGALLDYGTLDGSAGSDTLKITSGADGITVRGDLIIGGAEDCLDCNNRSRNNDVRFTTWRSSGRYVWTNKGGSHNNRAGGHIERGGAFCDVAIGEFSDQCNLPTTGTRLNFTKAGGRVVVKVFNGETPLLENGPEHYDVQDCRRWYRIWFFFKELFPKWL